MSKGPRINGLVLFICFLMVLNAAPIRAVEPYPSYTYNFRKEVVPAPQAYLPVRTITGLDLGVGMLSNANDLAMDKHHNLYISDSGNNRIICVDAELNVIRIIDEFTNNGKVDRFSNPLGLYVTPEGDIYVADSGNKRIVHLNNQGEYVREIGPPDYTGANLAETFDYYPLKVAVDPVGRIFVIARDIYEGFLEFDNKGKFRGFLGAPRVNPSIVDVFWYRFSTAEQRARMSLFLPTEYSSFTIDKKGLVFATIPTATSDEKIRRLTPAGANVLAADGYVPVVGDIVMGKTPPSVFVDVEAREFGTYSVLDRERGRIFTYDGTGNLLYVFGGKGTAFGTFREPVALVSVGDHFLVLDRLSNSITEFAPTDYARAIHTALEHYYSGRYEESAAAWQEVLKHNVNYDLAHLGIGRTLLLQEKYREAMDYFRLADERTYYSKAFAEYRAEVLKEYFGWAVLAVALLVWGVVRFLQGMGNKQERDQALRDLIAVANGTNFDSRRPWLSKLRQLLAQLRYSFHVMVHPFDGFWDLKFEGIGSLSATAVIMFLLGLTYVVMRQYTGFIFNTRDLSKLNIISEFASVIVPYLLWSVVNWAWTTLMDGKGTLKDIMITTAYALTPLIIINLPLTLISNYITVEEGTFYYLFLAIAVIWAMMLVLIGTSVVHDYSMGKTVISTVLIIVGMGTVLFIGMLFFSITDMLRDFVTSVYKEIVFRM